MATGKGQGSEVSEMMESARRWSGYVCPDCRFVFRVPRDHDGKGIVCPSCRRMLRIPTSADVPPLLMEQKVEDAEKRVLKKRRRKKKSESAGHAWELGANGRRSSRSEGRQMRLMLIGGGTLFSLIVAGVMVFLNRGAKAEARSNSVVVAPVVAAKIPGKPVIRSEASWVVEAEPLARKFLKAKTIEELLPLVRHPVTAEDRMRAFYPDGRIEAPGLSQFNTGTELHIREKLAWFTVKTDNFEEKSLAFVETPQGLRMDWESWVGWSEISWETFLSSKPVTDHLFRVKLSPAEYYNFGYADESKWQSYRLVSPNGEHSLYGYVEKGSAQHRQIRPCAESSNVSLMLSLKFPADAKSANQVEIERFVAEGWVEDETP
jgi:hypothetical protein